MVSFQEMLDVASAIEAEAKSQQLELPLACEDSMSSVEVPPGKESLFPELEPLERDAFPGSIVPVAAVTSRGVQVTNLVWGYRVPWQKGLVFNARVETALSSGRNMWAESLQRRRCLVAGRAFYEPAAHETVISPRTGKPVKRQYRFTLPGEDLLLFAAVFEGDCFSIMTCEPNRWVAPIHPRMPLVLAPHEAPLWLSSRYCDVLDRSGVCLSSRLASV